MLKEVPYGSGHDALEERDQMGPLEGDETEMVLPDKYERPPLRKSSNRALSPTELSPTNAKQMSLEKK